MQGGVDLGATVAPRQSREKNRDVQKHIAYALERKTRGLDPKIVRSLIDWDPRNINTARLGAAAPDFRLATISGRKVRLHDYRGKQAVVLVFVYGDT